VLGPQYRLKFDIASLTKSDIETYSAALLRLRQAGAISPNDVREELGWPSVDGGDDISPPNTSSAAVQAEPAQPVPPAEQQNSTVVPLHAAD
jgi:hypothetical protein